MNGGATATRASWGTCYVDMADRSQRTNGQIGGVLFLLCARQVLFRSWRSPLVIVETPGSSVSFSLYLWCGTVRLCGERGYVARHGERGHLARNLELCSPQLSRTDASGCPAVPVRACGPAGNLSFLLLCGQSLDDSVAQYCIYCVDIPYLLSIPYHVCVDDEARVLYSRPSFSIPHAVGYERINVHIHVLSWMLGSLTNEVADIERTLYCCSH